MKHSYHRPFLLTLLTFFTCYGPQYGVLNETPYAIGNFANLRKPITNFGLGQNIIKKDAIIFYTEFAQQKQTDGSDITLTPTLLYGITDYFSFFLSIPIFARLNQGDQDRGRHSGVGDLTFQWEYAYYYHTTHTSRDQATVMFNITAPTGFVTLQDSEVRKPSTGYGAPSFFFGGTYSRLTQRWYFFVSPGGVITTRPGKGTKRGNTFFYQTGMGVSLGNPAGTTAALLLEFNGIWVGQNSSIDRLHPNSGGNTIFLGPSIYITKGRWVLEGGVQLPIIQHLNGVQTEQVMRTAIIGSYMF